MEKRFKKELIQSITCFCGMWEEFPADMPRNSSQLFEHIKNHLKRNIALYKCPECKREVESVEKLRDIET